MDDSIRESILFYHNQIRQIQTNAEPESGGMIMLQYDMQLEEISQCWALRCDNEYSSCFMTPRYPETSQSVIQLLTDGTKTVNTFFWVQILNFWLGETKSLSADSITVMPGGEKGDKLHNYAQLLGDNIRSVGCAWSTSNGTVTFVCTYGPRGPIWGEPIYKTGKPCTMCPEGFSCNNSRPFQNLCKEENGIKTTTMRGTPPSPPPLVPVETPESPPEPATFADQITFPTIPAGPKKIPEPPPIPPNSCVGAIGCKNPHADESSNSPLRDEKSLTEKNFAPHYDQKFTTDSPEAEFVTNQRYLETSNIYYDQKQVSSKKRKDPRFDDEAQSQNGFKPLVPLRNIPHSNSMSSSLISQPIQPLSPPETFMSNMNDSFFIKQGKRPRILEATDFEPSQLVPSYHSTFDSPPNDRNQFFTPMESGFPSANSELKAGEVNENYGTPYESPYSLDHQPEGLHSMRNSESNDPGYSLPNKQFSTNSNPTISRSGQGYLSQPSDNYPSVRQPPSKQFPQRFPPNMPQKSSYNQRNLELSANPTPSPHLVRPPGALASPLQLIAPRPQGQLARASVRPAERFPSHGNSQRHRRSSSERLCFSNTLIALVIMYQLKYLKNRN